MDNIKNTLEKLEKITINDYADMRNDEKIKFSLETLTKIIGNLNERLKNAEAEILALKLDNITLNREIEQLKGENK